MIELINEDPKIYRIFVPLPQNPLKSLNSYVVRTEEGDLVIDTGFNREECLKGLEEGLDEIGVNRDKMVIFFTHLHSDHCGLANKLSGENIKIYMGKIDYEYLRGNLEGDNWDNMNRRFIQEGFPQEIVIRLNDTNQARRYAPDKLFKANLLEDGAKFKLGNIEFTAILTPGHTPGHMCLYIADKKILFSGDHVLFDITPNITAWLKVENSLKNYMESLKKIKNIEAVIVFPAHRENSKSLNERVDTITEHHFIRLDEIKEIIKKTPKLTAYEIASKMKWNMRGKPWSEFPDNQKWFATGETLSHLDYLYLEKKLDKIKDEEVFRYIIKE
ncbi:hydroxyacylglutathione hydrolase [Fusobacterium necrogenes]|uniref:Hydroxyacylglutathione hydrolase n=1 Tax=Fusobacterium necrogenes TaxID=858 RepID=A0A377GVZ5_9FUSO|nr:MBL fold metallo-hydrolase [Fusobacterium necrogenes]STO31116.1 hydroxyacylglutathione hydrolase [Fusobacterium necrogenes]